MASSSSSEGDCVQNLIKTVGLAIVYDTKVQGVDWQTAKIQTLPYFQLPRTFKYPLPVPFLYLGQSEVVARVVGVPVEQALLLVGLLKATVELLEGQLRMGGQVENPPVEMLRLHGKGHGHRRVAVQMGKLCENLHGGGHLVRAAQHQEAHGDMKARGGLPVRGGGGEEGGDLLLQLLEGGEDGRRVGPEGDEVGRTFLRGSTTAFLLSLLQR